MKTYLIVLFTVVLLCLLPIKNERRKNIMLPLSCFIIFVFLGIRYNYGIDYPHYELIFYNPYLYERGIEREFLFFKLASLFPKYYQFVLFQSACIMVTYYYMIRKYVDEKYYAFFLFVFMCLPGMMFTTMASMRNGFAALVFIWGTELFYIRKFNPILYLLSIVVAFFFHNSIVLMLGIFIMHKVLPKLSLKTWLILSFVGLIISLTKISEYVQNLMGLFQESDVEIYAEYIGDKFSETSTSIAILHSFLLIPGFFIYKSYIHKECFKTVQGKISILAITYILIYCFGLEFQNRVAVDMYIFLVIAIIYVIRDTKSKALSYFLQIWMGFIVLWQCRVMFTQLAQIPTVIGNYWFYQTIFDIPQLP